MPAGRSAARSVAACAGVAAAGLALSGCGRSVGVDPPAGVPAEQAAACAAAHALLPNETAAGRAWSVQPPSDLTAAWGSPATVWRCGLPAPAEVSPTAQLVEVSGVTWLQQPLTEGDQFTTLGRVATVQVRIPAATGPAASVLADLSAAITAAIAPVETS